MQQELLLEALAWRVAQVQLGRLAWVQHYDRYDEFRVAGRLEAVLAGLLPFGETAEGGEVAAPFALHDDSFD